MFEWITGIVEQTGYLGLLALMFAENVFPPIPSELIMPLGGYVAARGQLDFVLVVLAGAAGSLLGALPWYFAGRWLGSERLLRLATRHGRWLTLGEPEVLRAIGWFERHGGKAVFLGRLIPAVRTLISVPAGLARMPLVPFLAWSAAGTVLWTAALAAAGLWLEDRHEIVGEYLDSVSKIIVGLLVLTYVFRLLAGGALGRRLRSWADALRSDMLTVYHCARDPRVPWYAKAIAWLVAAYAISPVDLIPDFLPVLGHLDDLLLLPLAIRLVQRLVPAAVFEDNRRRALESVAAGLDWRIGALFVALWLVAAAFAARWVIGWIAAG